MASPQLTKEQIESFRNWQKSMGQHVGRAHRKGGKTQAIIKTIPCKPQRHWMIIDDLDDTEEVPTLSRRDQIVEVIISKTGWNRDWTCTQEMADELEEIEPDDMIEFDGILPP